MNNQGLADAFRKRYNRIVVVAATRSGETSEVGIHYRDRTFRIKEKMKDGKTEHVDLIDGERVNRYKTFLEAEVSVADRIGSM